MSVYMSALQFCLMLIMHHLVFNISPADYHPRKYGSAIYIQLKRVFVFIALATQSFLLCGLYLLHTAHFPSVRCWSCAGLPSQFICEALQTSLSLSLSSAECCLYCRVLCVLQIGLLAPPDPTARLKLAALFSSFRKCFPLPTNCKQKWFNVQILTLSSIVVSPMVSLFDYRKHWNVPQTEVSMTDHLKDFLKY